MSSGLHDASGFRIYYTANRRRHDIGILAIGQEYLQIPPRRQTVNVNGICSSSCASAMITDNVIVFETVTHMHLLGMYVVEQECNLTLPRSNESCLILIC